ncbi:MAG: general secretion pathway protein GspF [Thioalkalispiraceae bacterium]|jgi:hypothetical protein
MTRKKKYLNPNEPLKHADHARPVTRRQFIQQGFLSGMAAVTGPSLFGLFTNPGEARAALSGDIENILNTNCGGRPSSTKIPFICFDLAGGANIAGSNVLVGGAGGQMDFLSTAGYDKLGIPGDMIPPIQNLTDPMNPTNDFINTELGLAFHSDSGFLKGIKASLSAGTADFINGTVIPARSDNDTGNNPHNPMYGIYKAGQDGRLLTLIGSRNSDSGGNSMAPMSLYDASVRPTKVDRPSDVQGLVDTGKLVNLFSTDQAVHVMEAIQRLSDKKLGNVNTQLTNDAVIKEMVRCGYVKSADLVNEFGDPTTLNPDIDPDIVGATGIFSTTEYNSDSEFRKTASVMKLVCSGYAGAGTITMGGFDYHTGDRITGELRDYRAGRCMGACLEYARRKNTPLMLYVFSDGSVSSNGRVDTSTDTNGIYNGNKGEWTSDNSGTAASFFLVYNPGGRPQLIDDGSIPVELRQQIGYYTSDANVVTSSSPCANNVNLLVNTVLLNYMALNGDLSQFANADKFPDHGLGSNYDQLVSFAPL